MNDWEISLKWYPHFDAPIRRDKAIELANDPKRVANNSFYPFIRYEDTWQPYRSKPTGKPDKKIRPIRFASRRDSYILSRYRHLLSERYENLLIFEKIDDVVIAYRKIKSASGAGKSNIEFAKDAFDGIARIGNCAVVALDISSFFEHLDHGLLRKNWCRVLGVTSLPPDHEAVFRAMTRYAVVDRDDVYRRLGFIEDMIINGKMRATYTKKYKDMPKKLCSNLDLRNKICGHDSKYKTLVRLNKKPWGIPQGAPISDLLANLYLIDFDKIMKKYCTSLGGFYMRYSDDILIAIPGNESVAIAARDFTQAEITRHGKKLKIKDKKTAVIVFESNDTKNITFRHILRKNGEKWT